MQLIAVDIGNSSTKIAVVHTTDDDRWRMETVLRGNDPLNLDLKTLEVSAEKAFWAVSSVNQTRQKHVQDWIQKHRPDDQFHLIQPDEVDLVTDVESRSKLGRDRLIAAWMAVQLNNQSGPIIVIDAGTAVTVDWVDENLVFQGGLIFPGAESDFRQLGEYTDALPNLTRERRSDLSAQTGRSMIGKSTHSAIFEGVYQSQAAGIRGIVKNMESQSDHAPAIYATGGGIFDIGDRLPKEWNFVPDLVLRGTRSIGQRLINNN